MGSVIQEHWVHSLPHVAHAAFLLLLLQMTLPGYPSYATA